MKTSVKTSSPQETLNFAREFSGSLKPGDVIALSGPLGAGKTLFVLGVAEALKINEPITSPTFTIISEYYGDMPLYHMDLYRLGTPEEFTWLGTEEMLNGDGITMIEWSERAESELPERTIHVKIKILDENSREITVQYPTGDGR